MSQEDQQIRIGLTGGIGSGKTFVAKIFRRFSLPVFNADVEAKKCMVEDESLKQEIQNVFGSKVYIAGLLQTKKLADIVFNDSENLEKLNRLVHPVVRQSFEDWCRKQKSRIIIKEAAILFESDSHLDLDKVICVSAPEEIRIKRVVRRDKISKENVISIIQKQMPQVEKQKASDFVIVNDGVQLIIPQIISVFNQIS
tara:strand:+ start:32502 stop:33095 length:594 start_codon:yes stop_codon:yes gene_type:complete